MSEQTNALLLDIGNSFIKSAHVKISEGVFEQPLIVTRCDDVSKLREQIQASQRVVAAAVGQGQQVKLLESLCAELQVPLTLAKTQAQAFSMRCAYRNFSTLGVDRWLAVIAGRRISHTDAYCVIDLGTANTCDVVNGHQHLGGWIAPGFSLMRDSLIKNTELVFANDDFPNDLTLGEQTVDCVNMGCVAAVNGFIYAAEQKMRERKSEYTVIITGGGQELIKKNAPKHYYFHENLVLFGLLEYLFT
ncbi:type III pantothenate kinase [Paraglaciecola mesophila KMM 241]|uniref:Type III pantothenate kinase n=1 Tax=Paraglaciecola mesophila KMM 241 TaxID=1128912 RepID=K6YRJ3_9ALTE|nr:type III pantothenate kinase [Paraglaciecola mesophila]GAC26616.1 type III pantothenate kinase [Paraglaciecola mesophila KMM 241]